MLILVGVTINVVLNGGLFEQAQKAANDTQVQAEKEQLLSAVVASYKTETGTINKASLENNLGEEWIVEGDGPYTVKSPKNNVFTVNEKGTITPVEKGIVLEQTSLELVMGGECKKIEATLTGGLEGTITYSSSDESIAKVDPSTGEVTPVSEGTVTITATCGNYTATYTVIIQGEEDPIIGILNKFLLLGELEEEEAVMQIKSVLSIDDTNDKLFNYCTNALEEEWDGRKEDENRNKIKNILYYYIFENDRLYAADLLSDSLSFSRVTDTSIEAYKWCRNIKLVKEEFERIFVGKTLSEIGQIADLNEYIEENSEIITSVDARYRENYDMSICSTTIKLNNTDSFSISNDDEDLGNGLQTNYTMKIKQKDGKYYYMEIGQGT